MVYSYKDKENYYKVNKLPSDRPNRPSQPNRIDAQESVVGDSSLSQEQSVDQYGRTGTPVTNTITTNTHMRNEERIVTQTEQITQNYREEHYEHIQQDVRYDHQVIRGSNPQMAPIKQSHARMGPRKSLAGSNRKSHRNGEEELGDSRSDLQSVNDQDFQRVSMKEAEKQSPGFRDNGQHGYDQHFDNGNPGNVNDHSNQNPELTNTHGQDGYNDQPYFPSKQSLNVDFNTEVKSSPFSRTEPHVMSHPNQITPLDQYENYPNNMERDSRKILKEKTTEILKMRAEDGENILLGFLWRIEVERMKREEEKLKEKNNNLEGQMKRIEERLRELKMDFDEKCDEKNRLQEILDSQNEEGEISIEEMTIIKEKLIVLEQTKIRLLERIDNKDHELDEVDSALKAKDEEMKDLENQLSRRSREQPRDKRKERELNSKLEELVEDNEELTQDLEKLTRKNNKLEKRLKNMSQKNDSDEEMNAKNEELVQRIRELENQLKKLKMSKGKFGDEMSLIQAANLKMVALAEENQKLHNQIIVLNEDLEDEKENQTESNKLKEMMNFYKQRAEDLESNREHGRQQRPFSDEEEDEEIELVKASFKNRAPRNEVKNANRPEDEVDPAELMEMRETIDGLNHKLEQTQKSLVNSKEKNKNMFEELDKLKSKREKNSQAMQKLRNAKRELEREIMQIKSVPSEGNKLKREIERLKIQNEELKVTAFEKEKAHENLESSIIRTNEEVARLKALLRMKEDLEEEMMEKMRNEQAGISNSTVHALENRLRELESENVDLEKKLDDLMREYERESAKTEEMTKLLNNMTGKNGQKLEGTLKLLEDEKRANEEAMNRLDKEIERRENAFDKLDKEREKREHLIGELERVNAEKDQLAREMDRERHSSIRRSNQDQLKKREREQDLIKVCLLGIELHRKNNQYMLIRQELHTKEQELKVIIKQRTLIKKNSNKNMDKMLHDNKQMSLEKEMEINKLKMEKNKLLNYVEIYKKNTEEMERKIAKLIEKHESLKDKYTAQQNLISNLQASDLRGGDSRGDNKVMLGKIKELEMKNRVLEIENQKLDELLFEKMKEIDLKNE